MRNLLLLFLLFPFCVEAQENNLTVGGTGNDLYLTHKSAPKENYYSIGRLYNISPKEIAPYNKLVLEKGLSIGQTIKIPLKQDINFLQSGEPAADEAAVPLYHTVQPKETLYQLSTRYNKVPVANLKSWNKLSADAVSPGQKMIVGYLRVKKDLSAFAGKAAAVPVVKNTVPEMKEVPVKTEVVVKNEEPVIPKEEVKEKQMTVEKAVKQTIPAKTENAPAISTGGVFKTLYNASGKEETGMAGIFKSTSGWEDGKYYCLHNTAPQNSIIKITNKNNGKSVYAKVLDGIPDLKQNSDLVVRLSNAAADALGAGSNFECSINY